MCADATRRNAVTVHQLTEQVLYSVQLRSAGLLLIKVPEGHDPDIREIVILDMRALIARRTRFPHSTGPIHDEVIPDIAPASTSMRTPYRLDARCG